MGIANRASLAILVHSSESHLIHLIVWRTLLLEIHLFSAFMTQLIWGCPVVFISITAYPCLKTCEYICRTYFLSWIVRIAQLSSVRVLLFVHFKLLII